MTTKPPGRGERRLRIGLLSVYFSLFDEQMPPDFRPRLEAAAARYSSLLESTFDVVYPGLVASDEDGRRANEAFRQASVDVVVVVPTMAAPPSYAAEALDRLDVPAVIWNAPLVDRLGADLGQAGAHEHTTVISAVMLGNIFFRKGAQVRVVTASPGDPAGVERVFARVRAAGRGSILRGGVLLRVGDPIGGYLDVEATEAELEAVGLNEAVVSAAELSAVVDQVTAEQRDALRADFLTRGWHGEPDDRSLGVAVALLTLVDRYGAIGGTVNCHGPFFRFGAKIGICACLGVSIATARGFPFSCTGDQPTAIALVIGRAIAGAALYSEIFVPELATGLALLGNGGEGDSAWADGAVQIGPSQHYPGVNGRGASVAFDLKRGPCTLLSLSPGPSGWRGAWTSAEVVENRYPRMAAPNAMLRFRDPDVGKALDRWAASGATHHQALLAGDVADGLVDALVAAGIDPIQVA